MTLGVCAESGCPTLTSKTRCSTHERAKDAKRGRRQARGYDAEHDAARATWVRQVATGTVTCRRAASGHCLANDPLISPHEPWQLGHPDAECAAPRSPEHRRCNLATASRQTPTPMTPQAPLAED